MRRNVPTADQADKIEVTPEMIEAATAALNEYGFIEHPTPSNRVVILQILEAAFPGRLVFRERSPAANL